MLRVPCGPCDSMGIKCQALDAAEAACPIWGHRNDLLKFIYGTPVSEGLCGLFAVSSTGNVAHRLLAFYCNSKNVAEYYKLAVHASRLKQAADSLLSAALEM